MNLDKILRRDRSEYSIINSGSKSITGIALIDLWLEREVLKDPGYEIVWVTKPTVTVCQMDHIIPEVTQDMKVEYEEEHFRLNELRDRFGNGILYFYHRKNRVLYLKKPTDWLEHISVYEWDYRNHFIMLLEKDISNDGFPTFSGVFNQRKAIIKIITKQELRHMWE